MTWLAFRVEPQADREGVLAALFSAGAQGVHEDGTELVTHFPPGANVNAISESVRHVDPDARVRIASAADTDWAEAWKGSLSVQRLGALAIAPPWLAAGLDPRSTVVVDPGMAFGTGDHPTTRGVVRLMQSVVAVGCDVADLGAGSAVLAIAAAKLGARRVTAIEIDPDAIGNASENIERNGVTGVVHVVEGDAGVLLPLLAPVDVVLANIVSSVHVRLLPTIARALAPGGRVVLGGILAEERPALVERFAEGGWALEAEDAEDVWWSATISRR